MILCTIVVPDGGFKDAPRAEAQDQKINATEACNQYGGKTNKNDISDNGISNAAQNCGSNTQVFQASGCVGEIKVLLTAPEIENICLNAYTDQKIQQDIPIWVR